MEDEPIRAKATKTTFVYDVQTGEVVHIHQFIPLPGGTCSEREMEETALHLAPTAWDKGQLSVLHHDEELVLKPDHQYRVDIENRSLVVEPAPPDPSPAMGADPRTS